MAIEDSSSSHDKPEQPRRGRPPKGDGAARRPRRGADGAADGATTEDSSDAAPRERSGAGEPRLAEPRTPRGGADTTGPASVSVVAEAAPAPEPPVTPAAVPPPAAAAEAAAPAQAAAAR